MVTTMVPPRAYRELELSEIVLSDMDLRNKTAEEQLDGLGETLAEVGTLQPILVSYDSQSRKYKIVFGGRRVRAARLKKLKTIPAFIVDSLDDKSALTLMLVENMQRQALDPMEEARGLEALKDRFRVTESKVASMIGRPIKFVTDRLALLRLPGSIQSKLEHGRIGVTQAVCLTRIEGQEKTQVALSQKIEEGDLPVEIVERLVQEAVRPVRKQRRLTRKHRVMRRGELHSPEFVQRKLQHFLISSERMVAFLSELALDRWNPEHVGKLGGAIDALQAELNKFRAKVAKRAKAPK